MEPFELMLTGGHPNSLGRTVEVVDIVMANNSELEQLFQCYFSEDEVVRLRTSNAMKRLWRADANLIVPYVDRFLDDVAEIDQASAQWTFAQLFSELNKHITDEQRERAMIVIKRNLEKSNDWIVLNNSMETLGKWAKKDADLKDWLLPHIQRLMQDDRRSISGRATKLMTKLYGG